jgi:hypothetical protein
MQVSRDGGLTWSTGVPLTPRNPSAVGAIPVVQPTGTVVVVYLGRDEMLAARSTDGGTTFTTARIAEAASRKVQGLRDFPLPSADVDRSGRVYAAWHDCRSRPDCGANDIVLASSSDGVTWSPPRRVPVAPVDSPTHLLLPVVTADQATAGGRVAITYYVMPTAACDSASCRIDAAFVSSANGGATWSAPQRLSARSMRFAWIARSVSGRMLADYVATSYVPGGVVAIFALASPLARDGSLREAIFATRLAR